MSSLECEEKAADMHKKAADLDTNDWDETRYRYYNTYLKYRDLASEYEKQAADLRRRGY